MDSTIVIYSTVRTLGSLVGSQLLHMRPGELQMLCPQEAPRIQARLEAVRRMLGVRKPWDSDSYSEVFNSPGVRKGDLGTLGMGYFSGDSASSIQVCLEVLIVLVVYALGIPH